MNRLFSDKKIWLGAAISLVLVGVVFGPVLGRLKERLAVNRQLKTESLKLTEKSNTLNGIDELQVTQRVEKMEEVFPSQKPVVQLIASLNQLSGSHNLSFGGVTLRPGSLSEVNNEAKGGLQDLTFGFQVGGSFNDISLFLSDLENVAPLMKIDKVALAIKSNPLLTRDQTIVTANIEVSAFFQPPPKSLGAITAPVQLLSREDEVLLNRLFNFISFEAIIPTALTGKTDLFVVGL